MFNVFFGPLLETTLALCWASKISIDINLFSRGIYCMSSAYKTNYARVALHKGKVENNIYITWVTDENFEQFSTRCEDNCDNIEELEV